METVIERGTPLCCLYCVDFLTATLPMCIFMAFRRAGVGLLNLFFFFGYGHYSRDGDHASEKNRKMANVPLRFRRERPITATRSFTHQPTSRRKSGREADIRVPDARRVQRSVGQRRVGEMGTRTASPRGGGPDHVPAARCTASPLSPRLLPHPSTPPWICSPSFIIALPPSLPPMASPTIPRRLR
jgi:hypothetical protein